MHYAIDDIAGSVLSHVDKDGHRLCGIIDARAATLCFAGAGGPTPLIPHENWAVEEPKSIGPPLGIMEDMPYEEKTVKLEPGDSILLFSDGATEIQNAQNEWLGVETLV